MEENRMESGSAVSNHSLSRAVTLVQIYLRMDRLPRHPLNTEVYQL